MRRALALLELGPDGRKQLFNSGIGRPTSFGEILRSIARLPGTSAAILGAKRRWALSLT